MYQNVVRQILPVCLILAQLLFLAGTSFAEDSFLKNLIGQFGVGLSMTHNLGDRDRVDSAEVVNNVVRVSKEYNDIARVMLETHFFYVPQEFSFFRLIDAGKWGWGPFVGIQTSENKPIQAVGGGLMLGFLRKDKSLSELRCEVNAKKECQKDTSDKSECEYLARQNCELGLIEVCESKAEQACDKHPEKAQCITDFKAACKTAVVKEKTKDSFNIGIGFVVDHSAKVLGDGITENEPLPAGETQVRFKETSQTGIFVMVSYSF